MKIFVVIPTFNEKIRAVEAINAALLNTKNQVIVVDDGSKPSSYKLIVSAFSKNRRVTIVRHILNLGKGAAMKTGAEKAWEMGAEAIIFMDADGQHNPVYLKKFEAALRKNKLVFGYRDMGKDMPLIRRWGNIAAKSLVGWLFKIKRRDLLCGYLGFRKEVYKQIYWKSTRYGIETEMATRVGKNKLFFKEIKVDTIYIDKYKGVTVFDAFKILIKIPFWYMES